MQKPLLIIVLLLAALGLNATVLRTGGSLSTPVLWSDNGYTRVSLDQAKAWAPAPGYPELPAISTYFLLPYGEEVATVKVEGKQEAMTVESQIYPLQNQYPLSQMDKDHPFTQPLTDIYSGKLYPQEPWANQQEGYLRGFRVASVQFLPVSWDPTTKTLLYYTDYELEITTRSCPEAWPVVRNDNTAATMLDKLVLNPEVRSTYPGSQRTADDYDYLIVTSSSLESAYYLLQEYHNQHGLATRMYTIEDILAMYSSGDDALKLRTFIKEQYENHGISYLLLGGDTDVLPKRGFSVHINSEQSDDDICSNLYFTNLDGTWNTDNDNLYGEWAEKDMYSELWGGRIASSDINEANNAVNKQIMYMQNPVIADVTKDLLVGEDLGWTSWGSDYMEELHNGSSAHGYTTGGIPSTITTTTMYDTQSSSWTARQLQQALNGGVNLLGHLGHANVNYWAKMYNDDVTSANFTNNGTNHLNSIIYTQGCYCNSFDNRADDGSSTWYDAISEKLTTLANGPAVFVGNTRYGWGDNTSTNGASQRLQREFWDALYREGIHIIGQTQEDSRNDTAAALTSNSPLIWAYYECTVMGDPALDIWTASPSVVSTDLPAEINVGMGSMIFNVNSANSVENAMVTAVFGDEVVGYGTVNSTGIARLTFTTPINNTGMLTVNINGHNLRPFTTTLSVSQSQNASYVPAEVTVSGEDDGVLQPGETANLSIAIRNVGLATGAQISGVLGCDDERLTVTGTEAMYNDLAAGETEGSQIPYTVQVSGTITQDTDIPLSLMLFDTQGVWEYTINLPIRVPQVSISGDGVTEVSGNGNGSPDAGESLYINSNIVNTGSYALSNVSINLHMDAVSGSIVAPTYVVPTLPAGSSVNLNNLVVQLASDLPAYANVPVYLEVTASHLTRQYVYNFTVGAFCEGYETTFYQWQHQSSGGSGSDQWHRSNTGSHNGDYSYKCGATSGDEYANNMLATLTSPVINVPASSSLTFWHNMSAELNSDAAGRAYDGGYVQVSVDGGDYTTITPVGGYPYTTTGNTGSPLPGNTGVFSGSTGWQQVTFALPSQGGSMSFRFIFGSDASVTGDGWYLDDLSITPAQTLAPPSDLLLTDAGNNIVLGWTSPSCWVDSYTVMCNGQVIASNVGSNNIVLAKSSLTAGLNEFAVATVASGQTSEFSQPVSFTAAGEGFAAPVVTVLQGCYPNPFNPTTKVVFNLAKAGRVNLSVYDVRGRLVKHLVNANLNTGRHEVVWNGDGDNGRVMASGVYFARLQAGGVCRTGKMLMIK